MCGAGDELKNYAASGSMTLPTVAHAANPYLEVTTGWIYDQIRLLKRYRPIVLTQSIRNRSRFPMDPIYSSEEAGWMRFGWRLVRKLRGTYAGLPALVGDDCPDLLHAHFGQEGYRCLDARQAFDVPMVTTFYGMDVSVLPRRKPWPRRYHRLFCEGDGFLAEGPHMAGALEALGAPGDRVRVLALGVDLDAFPFRTATPDPECPVVLMYAVFREKKGHLFGIRAFARIADVYPKARLRLLGDGPLRRDIEREVARLGLEGRVTVEGMVTREEGQQALTEATLLLYPSLTAEDGDTEGGAPVALLEALATGVPVVATRHADIPFVIPDGCGLLADEKDVDGLAEALDALLGSPTLRAGFAEAGRRHVELQHDLARQVAALEHVYDTLR
jgi:glycosyltransferase involved in cell wall biosynthesis